MGIANLEAVYYICNIYSLDNTLSLLETFKPDLLWRIQSFIICLESPLPVTKANRFSSCGLNKGMHTKQFISNYMEIYLFKLY